MQPYNKTPIARMRFKKKDREDEYDGAEPAVIMAAPSPTPQRRRENKGVVHAESSNRTMVIVRYNESGSWYLEHAVNGKLKRLKLDEAVDIADSFARSSGRWFPGVAGGTAFDRKMVNLMIESIRAGRSYSSKARASGESEGDDSVTEPDAMSQSHDD